MQRERSVMFDRLEWASCRHSRMSGKRKLKYVYKSGCSPSRLQNSAVYCLSGERRSKTSHSLETRYRNVRCEVASGQMGNQTDFQRTYLQKPAVK